ncbi:MAG: hypothetical protein LBJ31_03360 [Treponema sp.]|jgi:tetratricopeptide (TPR) repeat protein|nr:hypothetical protein [Treponema sp.]
MLRKSLQFALIIFILYACSNTPANEKPRNPEEALAYVLLGIPKIAEGDYNGAIADFTRAIELDRRCIAAYQYRSHIHSLTGNTKLAFADINNAITLAPLNAELYLDRGALYHNRGDYNRALDDENRFLELISGLNLPESHPLIIMGHHNRGKSYKMLNKYEESLQDFNFVIAQAPDNEDVYYDRAVSNYYLKNYQEALDDITMSINLEPVGDGKYSFRSYAYSRLGMYQNALDDLYIAIKMNPNVAHYAPRIKDLEDKINSQAND